MKDQDVYTTGEIAKMAGVTTRTIRYYDNKGILSPSSHNSSGHRLYTESDFIKLKRILALKYLGLSLEEVKNTESQSFEKEDIISSLRLQKNIMKNKINYMKTVLHALESAEKSIEDEVDLDWNKTTDIIKILEDEKELLQQYMDSSNLDASIKLQDRFSSNKHGWYKWTFNNIKLDKKYKVLEIGCGNGVLWSKNIDLLDKDISITLTDVCEDMINNAKKNLSNYSDIFDFQIVDPYNIPFENESFDLVIANHILFYMKDVDKVLNEIKRVLKIGGYFYSSTIDSKNMKELESLVKGFNSNIKISEEKISSNFGLENGEGILSKHFCQIKKYLYEDKLVINDAKGILEYIYSIPGNIIELIDTKKKDFEKYIDSNINKQGNIYITNNQIYIYR